MRDIAFMFPGQGAQYVGMGQELCREFPEAREVFTIADQVLDMPLSRLCLEGPETELVKTEVQQPAILTTSVAVLRVLEARGIRPARVAGLSLGEYTALVAAGVLAFEDAVALVRDRGRYMQEAVPPGRGAMAAVLGLDAAEVAAACRRAETASGGTVQPANFNCPGQVVIAGDRTAVEGAVGLCRDLGARKAVLLPVSAPFHCSLMRPAAKQLARRLDQVGFRDAAVPVVSNVDAAERTRAEAFPPSLVAQVDHPVLWQETVAAMARTGCETFVEVGPGRTLSGFLRRIDKGLRAVPVEGAEALEELLACAGEVC